VPLPDSSLTPEERRRAVAEILAGGVRRTLEGLPLPEEPEPVGRKRPPPPPTSGGADALSPPNGVR
jgi:hypothetical protein